MRVDIHNGRSWDPHFHGTMEECEDERDDLRDSGERARIVADNETKGLSETAAALIRRTVSAPAKPEATSPGNTAERRELGSLIAELADDDYVTTTEAAAVVEWCREWVADVYPDEEPDDGALLRGCHRHIDGGLRFVLDDVRRVAAEDRGERGYRHPDADAGYMSDMIAAPGEQASLDVPASYPLGFSSLTDAQALTVDNLADAEGFLAMSAVHVDLVPAIHEEENGSVLAIITCDSPAEDPVTRVWQSDGRDVYYVLGEESYMQAVATVRAKGLVPLVQRESSAVYVVAPGGAYERRRFT